MNVVAKVSVCSGARGKALVADDEHSNRVMISTILKHIGYEVIQAGDGSEAVALYKSERPDIILMDVMMPVMDGYQAVNEIRSIPTDRFIPIIFLTGISDEQELARCIEVGGDDFLTKPFSTILLKAKIQSMERISQLHNQINMLHARTQHDQRLAREVFASAVISENVALRSINTLLKPAEIFSGDVLLTAYSPSGDLNILMGDFTGHGLAAALGAMPTSDIFRAMTNKGFSPQQILSAINSKLLGLLPTGMFMAVQFVAVAHTLDHVFMCNCGMPDILLLNRDDHQIKHRTPSRGVPLGIRNNVDFGEFIELIKINHGDKILLSSDGVIEAINNQQEQFGNSRLEDAITNCCVDESLISCISQSLYRHCGKATQTDDISLAEIPCDSNLLQEITTESPETTHNQEHTHELTKTDSVCFSLALHGKRLCDADPIPLLINHIQEIDGLEGHRRILYTILTELYTNALDHGVLGMDSSLKQTQDGFTLYFTEREKRLEHLTDGFIRINLSSRATENGGEIVITIADSGPGFDYRNYQYENTDHSRLFGRGLQLLNELCSALSFAEPGNQIEAIYSWTKN